MTQQDDFSRRKLFKSAGGVGAMALMAGLGQQQAHANAADGDRFGLDVCFNGTTMVFQGPTHDDGSPDFGAPFLIEGVIYPGGTFASKGTDRGLLEDGSPEFPDEVAGIWYCWGNHINQGAQTPKGEPWVFGTQYFELDPDNPGSQTLLVTGIELHPGVGQSFARVLVGGSGDFAGRSGEVIETIVGFNGTKFCNASFVF